MRDRPTARRLGYGGRCTKNAPNQLKSCNKCDPCTPVGTVKHGSFAVLSLSLLNAHFLRDQEVGGSNPLSPIRLTTKQNLQCTKTCTKIRRMRKPWFRSQDGYWYVTEGNKKIKLDQDRDEALRKWHKLQLAKPADAPNAPLASIVEAFLDWSQQNQSSATYQYHIAYLGPFSKRCGHYLPADFKPYHLTKWLDDAKFTRGARAAAIANVKAALNWAVREGLIPSNPVASVTKPPKQRREVLIDDATRLRILEKTDGPFRLVVTALSHLGCRPREVREVDAAKFDERLAAWVFPPDEHKTGRRTGRKRIIHLTPCLQTMSRILAANRPQGALFRNRDGEPWTCNAIRCRMRRLRESLKLPAGVVAYSFRHSFTTAGMTSGVDSATLAELLGHRDTSMIDRHYGHLDQKARHLKEAMAKISSKPREDSSPGA